MPGPDAASAPVRVAFVGRFVEDGWTAPSAAAEGLEPVWIEHRSGGGADALLARLRDAAPDVVVVLRPERVPAGLLREVDAPALAVLPDPVELSWGEHEVWDTNVGFLTSAIAESGGRDALVPAFDVSQFARVAAVDPLVARVAPDLRLWRCPPLPVDDALFLPDRGPQRPPRPLFLGPSTPRREDYLIGPKHFYELTHYAFGLAGGELRRALERANVGVALYPAWSAVLQPRALVHLAAGHLLVTQPLIPTRGLEPGLDHLVIEAPDQLMRVLDQLRERPAAYERVRIRGRRRAEGLRASRVWSRLLADLQDDLAAFGAAA